MRLFSFKSTLIKVPSEPHIAKFNAPWTLDDQFFQLKIGSSLASSLLPWFSFIPVASLSMPPVSLLILPHLPSLQALLPQRLNLGVSLLFNHTHFLHDLTQSHGFTINILMTLKCLSPAYSWPLSPTSCIQLPAEVSTGMSSRHLNHNIQNYSSPDLPPLCLSTVFSISIHE